MTEAKGRKPVHFVPTKKQMETAHNNLDAVSDDFSILTAKSSISEKEREELILLREQVEELRQKLIEKEEVLKSAEESINRFSLALTEIGDLKHQIEEKDSLVRSVHLQLNETKVPGPFFGLTSYFFFVPIIVIIIIIILVILVFFLIVIIIIAIINSCYFYYYLAVLVGQILISICCTIYYYVSADIISQLAC